MPVNPEDRARAAPARDVYSVTRVNREVRALLERGLGGRRVKGELSNFSQPSSGHWYFSLKDRDAQLRCAMFRMQNSLVGFTPRAGTQVLVRGRISVYEARGEYQLIVEHLEEAGIGALRREFERLKAKLAAEGLFALECKRSLPRFPQRIGVITSPSGAALRDILHVLARRYPPARVLIYPAAVQGAAAVPALVAALQTASARAECEVLILARGGGSLEDLWAFNDERVARAIRACRLPVVSGVGHEIDFTIADLAADARAPPPRGPRSWWCRIATRVSRSWRAPRCAWTRACAASCARMARASRAPSGACSSRIRGYGCSSRCSVSMTSRSASAGRRAPACTVIRCASRRASRVWCAARRIVSCGNIARGIRVSRLGSITPQRNACRARSTAWLWRSAHSTPSARSRR